MKTYLGPLTFSFSLPFPDLVLLMLLLCDFRALILLALVVLAVLLFTEAVSLCFWLNSRVGVFGDAYSFL